LVSSEEAVDEWRIRGDVEPVHMWSARCKECLWPREQIIGARGEILDAAREHSVVLAHAVNVYRVADDEG
jgi:hypothetical protein